MNWINKLHVSPVTLEQMETKTSNDNISFTDDLKRGRSTCRFLDMQ